MASGSIRKQKVGHEIVVIGRGEEDMKVGRKEGRKGERIGWKGREAQ